MWNSHLFLCETQDEGNNENDALVHRPQKKNRRTKVGGMATQRKSKSIAVGNMDPNESDVDLPVADHSRSNCRNRNDNRNVDLPVADHSRHPSSGDDSTGAGGSGDDDDGDDDDSDGDGDNGVQYLLHG
jgi:hypothetical protein